MSDQEHRQHREPFGTSVSDVRSCRDLVAAQLCIAHLQAENRLLRARVERAERAEQLADVRDHALIAMDLAGRIIHCNAGASTILGYADGELLGQSGAMLFLPEDRDRGLFQEELCWAIEEGRASNERWHLRRDGSRFWASGSMMPLLDNAGRPLGFLNVFRDNTALRMDGEHRALLMAEMSHRMKNTFATMQAVGLQTLRRGGVSKEIQDTFEARLIALARSHELLTRNQWHGAALPEVLERALLPYGDGERATLKGPQVWLPAQAVELLGLAFHELVTNAAKYGALSVPDGFIDIGWHLKNAADGTRLAHIVWRERGGPLVTVPAQRGFGSRLLEQGVVQTLDGTLKLAFHPEGLECSICLPVAQDHKAAATGKQRSHPAPLPGPLA